MRILVSAESFGYGPISTCLEVVKELKKHEDVILDFIGSGISLEQAKMSGYFDKFYVCDTFDLESLKKHEDVFKEYNIFFDSENIQGGIFALKYIKNMYYVDNLVWMWDKIDPELGKAKKFYVSETFSCKENFERVGDVIKNPVFVGPVRDLEYEESNTSKNQLLINIGGASSFLFNQNIINDFYNVLLNNIVDSLNLDEFDKVLICGGSKVIDNLKINNLSTKIEVKTIAHEEYLKEMKVSKKIILSSGLGNFIESLNLKKDILYLPPVNYSQLLQLNYYKKMEFGFDMINWSDFDFYKEIPELLDEATGVNMVVDNVINFMKKDYQLVINKKIENFINNTQEEFYKLRSDNFNNYDKNAAKIIAYDIYNENK